MKNRVAMMVIKVCVRNWVQPQELIGYEIHSPYQKQGTGSQPRDKALWLPG